MSHIISILPVLLCYVKNYNRIFKQSDIAGKFQSDINLFPLLPNFVKFKINIYKVVTYHFHPACNWNTKPLNIAYLPIDSVSPQKRSTLNRMLFRNYNYGNVSIWSIFTPRLCKVMSKQASKKNFKVCHHSQRENLPCAYVSNKSVGITNWTSSLSSRVFDIKHERLANCHDIP